MGIEWHTLVDGDEAGKKYAATALSYAEKMHDTERDRLTRLPAPDMEHFYIAKDLNIFIMRYQGYRITRKFRLDV